MYYSNNTIVRSCFSHAIVDVNSVYIGVAQGLSLSLILFVEYIADWPDLHALTCSFL